MNVPKGMLQYIEHKENIVLLGLPGVGKTHLAVSLAVEAISKRYSVYFFIAHDLVQSLQEAHRTNTIRRKLRLFTKA